MLAHAADQPEFCVRLSRCIQDMENLTTAAMAAVQRES